MNFCKSVIKADQKTLDTEDTLNLSPILRYPTEHQHVRGLGFRLQASIMFYISFMDTRSSYHFNRVLEFQKIHINHCTKRRRVTYMTYKEVQYKLMGLLASRLRSFCLS